jgi:DNA-binding transcriptional MerR regulator
VPSKADLPDKLYFKIGEVASIIGVKPYVLRYWESEFSTIKPAKTKSKHRLYRRRDVEVLREIRRLLYEERLTIEGAKKRLKIHAKKRTADVAERHDEPKLRAALSRLKRDLESLHRMLS